MSRIEKEKEELSRIKKEKEELSRMEEKDPIRKQVTRGHDIVADGWAAASKACFPIFRLVSTDRQMDRQTDGRTKSLMEFRVRN